MPARSLDRRRLRCGRRWLGKLVVLVCLLCKRPALCSLGEASLRDRRVDWTAAVGDGWTARDFWCGRHDIGIEDLSARSPIVGGASDWFGAVDDAVEGWIAVEIDGIHGCRHVRYRGSGCGRGFVSGMTGCCSVGCTQRKRSGAAITSNASQAWCLSRCVGFVKARYWYRTAAGKASDSEVGRG